MGDQAHFEVADFSNLPYEDNFFDAVITFETFTHSPDAMKTIKEFIRVLKPGGYIVLEDYETTNPKDIDNEYDAMIINIVSEETSCPGFRSFNHGFYKDLFTRAKLENIEVVDITDKTTPTLKFFLKSAYIPFKFIKLFNKERKFINTTVGAKGMDLVEKGHWKCVVAVGKKPS